MRSQFCPRSMMALVGMAVLFPLVLLFGVSWLPYDPVAQIPLPPLHPSPTPTPQPPPLPISIGIESRDERLSQLLRDVAETNGWWNPRWNSLSYRDVCQRLRCIGTDTIANPPLPSVLYAGCMKCATTDIWRSLSSHVSVLNTYRKERQFFNGQCNEKADNLGGGDCTITGYRCSFGEGAGEVFRMGGQDVCRREEVRRQTNSWGMLNWARSVVTEPVRQGMQVGSRCGGWNTQVWKVGLDATPVYMRLYDFPELSAALNPDAQLLITLRHPIGRMLSHYSFIAFARRPSDALDELPLLILFAELSIEAINSAADATTTDQLSQALLQVRCAEKGLDSVLEGHKKRLRPILRSSLYISEILNALRTFSPPQLVITGFIDYTTSRCSELRRIARLLCIHVEDEEDDGNESEEDDGILWESQGESQPERMRWKTSCGGYFRGGIAPVHDDATEEGEENARANPTEYVERPNTGIALAILRSIARRLEQPTLRFFRALHLLGAHITLDVEKELFGEPEPKPVYGDFDPDSYTLQQLLQKAQEIRGLTDVASSNQQLQDAFQQCMTDPKRTALRAATKHPRVREFVANYTAAATSRT